MECKLTGKEIGASWRNPNKPSLWRYPLSRLELGPDLPHISCHLEDLNRIAFTRFTSRECLFPVYYNG
jgi:hypothetical protein